MAALKFGSCYDYLLTVDSVIKRHRLGSLVTIGPVRHYPAHQCLVLHWPVRPVLQFQSCNFSAPPDH